MAKVPLSKPHFSYLIEKCGQTPEKKPSEPQKPTLFSINNISIQDGEITFTDQIKNSQQHITAINLSIPFIANFKNVLTNWVEPNLSAKINEAPVILSGKVLPFSNKQEATLSLKLDDIDLTNIDEYSPIPLGIRLLSGKFDSDLLVSFSHVIDEPPNIDLSGQIALKGIQIENKTVEMPYVLDVKHFGLKLNEVSFNEASILAIDAGHLSLGAAADICIFDPDAYWKVTPSTLKSQGKNSPFMGMELPGSVKYTLVGGNIIYQRCN